MKRKAVIQPWILLAFVSFAQIIFVFLASADSLPAMERQRIEALIRHVAESKDVKFVRNGATYGAAHRRPFSTS
jgi:hypothetical protein